MSKQLLRRDDDIPACGPCPLDEPRRFPRVPRTAAAPQHHPCARQAQDEPEPAPPGSHADRGDDESDPGRRQHTRDPHAPRHRRERAFKRPAVVHRRNGRVPEATRHQRAPPGSRRRPCARSSGPRSSGHEPPIQPREARAQAPSTNGCRTGRPSATCRRRRERPDGTSRRAPRPSFSGSPLQAARRCPAARSTRRERPRPTAARTGAPRRRTRGAILRPPRERSDEIRDRDRARATRFRRDPESAGRDRQAPDGRYRMPSRCTPPRDRDRSASGGSFPASRSRRSGARRRPRGLRQIRSTAAGQATARGRPRRRRRARAREGQRCPASRRDQPESFARPRSGHEADGSRVSRQQDLLRLRAGGAGTGSGGRAVRAGLEELETAHSPFLRRGADLNEPNPYRRRHGVEIRARQRAALEAGDDDDLAPGRRRRGQRLDRLQYAGPELRRIDPRGEDRSLTLGPDDVACLGYGGLAARLR